MFVRSTVFALAGAIALTATAPVAAKQWQNINQRQERLYNRIEQGIRSGTLNRREADRMRTQFVRLEQRERDYRRSNGLSRAERADLNQRFDRLSARLYNEKHDRQYR